MRGGYLGDDAKTAEAVRAGWMHSGDLAKMDDNVRPLTRGEGLKRTVVGNRTSGS